MTPESFFFRTIGESGSVLKWCHVDDVAEFKNLFIIRQHADTMLLFKRCTEPNFSCRSPCVTLLRTSESRRFLRNDLPMAAAALSLVRSCELTLMTGGFQSICLLDHPATVPFPKPAKEWQLSELAWRDFASGPSR